MRINSITVTYEAMKTIVILVIAVASALSMLPVILSIGLLTTVSLPSTAVAQQQQSNVSRPILSLTSGNKTFYEISEEIPEFNETKEGIPGDVYSTPILVVEKGDNVTVHLFNTEANATDRHSFTTGAPYNIDIDLAGGEKGNATFTANQEGVFIFYCRYHLPTMTGELVVLPKPTSSP
jgi:plastocyanin